MNNYKFNDLLFTDIRITQQYITGIEMDKYGVLSQITNNDRYIYFRVFDGNDWTEYSEEYDDQTNYNIILKYIYSKFNLNLINKKQIEYYKLKCETNKYKNNSIIKTHNLFEYKNILLDYLSCIKDNKSFINEGKIIQRCDRMSYFSSTGSEIDYTYDGYEVAIKLQSKISDFAEVYYGYVEEINDLKKNKRFYIDWINKIIRYIEVNKSVKGKHDLILSNKAAGIFIHECLGHLSEADLSIDDDGLKKKFSIKEKIGINILNVIDDGGLKYSGWTPYDDDGTSAKKTHIIKNGQLNNMLNSNETAYINNSNSTGNARAISAKFKPMVRMTNTYIDAGNMKLRQLLEATVNGIYIDSFSTCYGYKKITLVINRAYIIRNGKIEEPVFVPPIISDAVDLIRSIDSICEDLIFFNSILTGCAKDKQSFLRVSFGSPHIRIKDIRL